MSTNLTDANRLRAVCQYASGETAQFATYTGKRDPANHADIAQEWFDFIEDCYAGSGTQAANLLAPIQTLTIHVDEFENPVFSLDGWGSVWQQQFALPGNSNDPAPPQLSVVVSLETDDSELPVRRRRNRFYLGPVAQESMGPDGYLAGNIKTALPALVQVLHASLQGVPLASGVPAEYDGLVTASYRGTSVPLGPAQAAQAVRVRTGRVFDTQRRRRNALVEDYTVLPLA